ncbi:hypothetical protein yc1106_06745 [Curvularia clavata]|uniref:Uncharacterized protein n=1 Tax=Curvularia clavata TaxID=95742 RepID=A0A9Q8ZC37_CURCL|nr:hypothetical protein yc1106_06745 [Curvularia clavata]
MFRLPNYSAPADEGIALSPYCSPSKNDVYANEQNPFDALRRASETSEEVVSDEAISPTSTWSSSARPNSSPSPFSPAVSVSQSTAPIRRQIVKSKTFPIYERASRVTAATEGPRKILPELIPLDEQAKTLRLQVPFIYATQSSNLPQYQTQPILDRTGRVSRLDIRRIHPHETRSCSVPARYVAQGRRIRYDEKSTLYSISEYEMKGQSESALKGSIQLTTGKTLWGGQWTRIWHVTRCQAQHQACDYRGSCEPEKHLLFCIKKGVWEDAEGEVVGREGNGRLGSWVREGFARWKSGTGFENENRILEMMDSVRRNKSKSDLLVACWVMRLWMAGEFTWEEN